MSNLGPWTVEELENATARPLGLTTSAGRWYTLREGGTPAGAIALSELGVCDLTMAGEAYRVTEAALDLGGRRMSAAHELRAGKLANAAAEAMEHGERVRLTNADFTELDLGPYVDKDDFGAALMFCDGDTDRPTALCIFGSDDGENFRA